MEIEANTEPTQFFDWTTYIASEEGAGDLQDNRVTVSTHGVQIGEVVISMVNGSLCANPIDEEPYSINFGAYMADVLANMDTTGEPRMVVWDPAQARYVLPESIG